MHAPVALFTYKRPEHTRATLSALTQNTLASATELVIYCDGPKTEEDRPLVEAVRRLIRQTSGFASVQIIERECNIGLANSITAGVTDLLKTHESIIVIEDDLVTSPHFLEYMNEALVHYRNDPKAFSIGAYNFPIKTMPIPSDYPWDTYVSFRCCSWGWATWADRWKLVNWDMDYYSAFIRNQAAQETFNRGGPDMTQLLKLQHEGRIDSWAIRFCYAHYANSMHCIYPVKSLVRNIGLDNSGSHCGIDPRREHERLDEKWVPRSFCRADYIDPRLVRNFYKAFSPPEPSFPTVAVQQARKVAGMLYHKARRLAARVRSRVNPSIRDVDILVVNTSHKDGGAARAAFRIFCGIRHRYLAAHYLTLTKEGFDAGVTGHVHTSIRGIVTQRLMGLDRIPLLLYPKRQQVTFSPAFWANPLRTPLNRFRAKLVHLHWVGAGMLRVEELGRLRCPIVWTLHDSWAFTGGCHYMRDCEGYKKQCGYCPQLGSQSQDDYSHRLMRRKTKAFRHLDITVVTPSRWLAETAKQSSLFAGKRIEVIPNGLDTDTFRPIDHNVARQYFSLPTDKSVLLFGAQWLTDPRKGADLLCDALKQLEQPYTLLLFGRGMLPLENFSHISVRRLGNLIDDISLAMVYSAADVFVCPSREDNLPNTVAEALACGTPCAAFAVNGLPDMIEHKKNGWLAQPFDTADLADGIRWLTRNPRQDQLRQAAREKAVSEYNLTKMSHRYMALYEDVLKAEH